MLPPHLRKFSDLYESYGLGAVKNVWLLTCLLPLARTVNLYKMKDFVGGVLEKESTKADSHYKRLIRFFQDWSDNEALFGDLVQHNLRFLRGSGFKTLVALFCPDLVTPNTIRQSPQIAAAFGPGHPAPARISGQQHPCPKKTPDHRICRRLLSLPSRKYPAISGPFRYPCGDFQNPARFSAGNCPENAGTIQLTPP